MGVRQVASPVECRHHVVAAQGAHTEIGHASAAEVGPVGTARHVAAEEERVERGTGERIGIVPMVAVERGLSVFVALL